MVNDAGHRRKWLTWRSWHKWVGMVFSVFIILFCVSGIVLNHRHTFSRCEVSRWWLPEPYHIHHWNQNIIKGTAQIENGRLRMENRSSHQGNSSHIIAYGQAGVWLTDRQFKEWRALNDGLDEGIDNRKISGVVQTGDGTLWCAALWDAYRYDGKTGKWVRVPLPGNDERLSDITLRGGDTIIVASRSVLYEAVAPRYEFKRIELMPPSPDGEGRGEAVSLFKTVWWLHSGQLFGTVGKLIVDFIGVVLIILCLTGIVFFVLSYTRRYNIRVLSAHAHGRVMHENLKWHNRLGAYLIVLTLFIAVTGMCLRPPLMVPLVLNKTAPVPGSTLDTDNAWFDKLRAIRWDDRLGLWLLSTSEGFYQIENGKWRVEDSDVAGRSGLETAVPVKVDGAPRVSPMGITVFQRNPADSTEWLIGSFAGLERWNPQTGEIHEWFDDAPPPSPIPSTNGHLVTGFSQDFSPKGYRTPIKGDAENLPLVFEYSSAPCAHSGYPQEDAPPMPEVLKSQPMSLWNFALELHVGRCYEPFLGSVVSILFVFISGLLLTLILISGYIINRRST